RKDASTGKHRHSTDDPWNAPASEIGTVTEPGTQHLQGVVNADQQAGQHCRQGQLDDHHAIERGCREHNDGAECRLHQAEPDNPEPGEHLSGSSHHASRPARANALTSMPRTYSVTPVPLYQGASSRGCRSRRRISNDWTESAMTIASAWTGRCQTSNRAT